MPREKLMPKLKKVLRGDYRIQSDGPHDDPQIYRHVNEYLSQMYLLVPKCFKNGDKVRVTVELVERAKAVPNAD